MFPTADDENGDTVTGLARVERAMRERMIYRDRVCFASKETIAKDAGVSTRTVQRAWKQLEASGRWSHSDRLPEGKRVRTKAWVCHEDVSQRSPSPRTTSALVCYRSIRTEGPRARRASSSRCGRMRRLMEKHPEVLGEGVERADGSVTPFNAGDAVAAVCDMYGLPLPPSYRARLGKAAKGLLDSGFDANVVVAAMLTAVQMARPHLVESFAVEFQNAAAGRAMGWSEYRERVREIEARHNPELQRIYDTLKEAFK